MSVSLAALREKYPGTALIELQVPLSARTASEQQEELYVVIRRLNASDWEACLGGGKEVDIDAKAVELGVVYKSVEDIFDRFFFFAQQVKAKIYQLSGFDSPGEKLLPEK